VRIRNISCVFIAGNVLIDSRFTELVEHEDEAYITRNVVILTHFAPSLSLEERVGGVHTARVVIRRGAYIGVGAIIWPGVRAGKKRWRELASWSPKICRTIRWSRGIRRASSNSWTESCAATRQE